MKVLLSNNRQVYNQQAACSSNKKTQQLGFGIRLSEEFACKLRSELSNVSAHSDEYIKRNFGIDNVKKFFEVIGQKLKAFHSAGNKKVVLNLVQEEELFQYKDNPPMHSSYTYTADIRTKPLFGFSCDVYSKTFAKNYEYPALNTIMDIEPHELLQNYAKTHQGRFYDKKSAKDMIKSLSLGKEVEEKLLSSYEDARKAYLQSPEYHENEAWWEKFRLKEEVTSLMEFHKKENTRTPYENIKGFLFGIIYLWWLYKSSVQNV
jgi:hypothetical protein